MPNSSTQYMSGTAAQQSKLYKLLLVVIGLLTLMIIILIVLVILVASSGNSNDKNAQKTTNTATQAVTQTPTVTVTPTVDPTAGWKTYKNVKNNFSFKLPTEYGVAETGAIASSDNLYVGLQKDVDFVVGSAGGNDFLGIARITVGTSAQIPVKNDVFDVKQESVTIGGKAGTTYTQTNLIDIPGLGSKGKVTKIAIVQNGSKVYTFSFYDQTKLSVLELMLKSVTF